MKLGTLYLIPVTLGDDNIAKVLPPDVVSIAKQLEIFVVENELGTNELAVGTIANTFNKHFRQAKMIQSNHVSAALGQSKKKNKEALIGENTVANPTTWFLTTKGKEFVQSLIKELTK